MEKIEELVVIFMGSKKDRSFAAGIKDELDRFGVESKVRAISAHKAPRQALAALEEYEGSDLNIVFIAVAGKSNALGPVLAANSCRPVINCPPLGEFKQDIYSSLRTPGGVPCSTILEPENAALHAVKILATSSEELRDKLDRRRKEQKEAILADDEAIELN